MKPALTVAHAAGEYPIYIGPGILTELPALARLHLPGRRSAMIADHTVASLYRAYLRGDNAAWRMTGRTCSDETASGWVPLEFPAGEAAKTRATWERLTDLLLEQRYGRDSAVLALGGGVTGDLAGFVAATYLRGVPLLQVPTTLLAMLDSSVGGKVGVDTAHGKNLVGAFHPPAAVIADPLTLGTLPDREFRSGLAEAVKHGLIADAAHLDWLESNAAAVLRRDAGALAQLIVRSVTIKAEVVAGDERESGRRAILNAGHTVAHALELATGYAIPHGEAVAIGLVAECGLGEALGVTRPGTRARIESLLDRLGLPIGLAGGLPTAALVAAMIGDKKSRGGGVGFALVSEPGKALAAGSGWVTSVELGTVEQSLRAG